MVTAIRTAEERRKDIHDRATALQIDDAYVSLLVDTFYGRIRRHPMLGPIFEKAIGDEWDPHLARMKDFWASVAFNAGRYNGRPVPKHRALTGVNEAHFTLWLNLFEQTLKDTAPNPEAIPYFMERANRIAESLKLAMFGIPGLPPIGGQQG